MVSEVLVNPQTVDTSSASAPAPAEGRQISASSSNRNFKGRQGSPTGRTLLMSPAMVAAAAIAGEVVDVRTMLEPVPA